MSSSPEAMASTILMFLRIMALVVGSKAQASASRKLGPSTNTTEDMHLPTASIILGIISVVIVTIVLLLSAVAFFWRWFYSQPGTKLPSSPQVVQFSWSYLVEATNNFSDRIGSGILGTVYRGVLPDNRTLVAVKKLESYHRDIGDRIFRDFVSRLSSLPHENLVKLHGFCTENQEKMLLYEFVPNGSLDKVLFTCQDDCVPLDWKSRCRVAVSIAKGVAHLHQGQVPFVHGNLKTENILLDGDFGVKVSDAGLSELVDRKKITMALNNRGGLHGYFSPEWISNAPLTTKSDVYGFGMVLLELIAGRRVLDLSLRCEEQWNLVEFALKQVEIGNYHTLVDPRLVKDGLLQQQLKCLVDIALSCVREDAKLRPSMLMVLQLLEEEG